MSESYVGTHLKRGKTHEEIIDYVLDEFKPIPIQEKEYRGITWRSDSELCRKLGKRKEFIISHMRKGKTYEQIIDYVLNKKNKTRKRIQRYYLEI
jgi:cytochrome c-type biogenesis protein CcmH/NrfF